MNNETPICFKHKIRLEPISTNRLACGMCMEEAAIKNLANFGRPEMMGCNICGEWFLTENFLTHPCVNAKP